MPIFIGAAPSIDRRARPSFREHQLHLRAELPVGRVVGPYDVVIRRYLRVHGQLAEVKDLPYAAA
jgi:hypothetical protein